MRTLRDQHVVITGRVSVGTRPEALRLAQAVGARVSQNPRARISESTDLLVRGSKDSTDRTDELALMRLQGDGHHILMVDDAGFCSLLEGGWAYAVKPFGEPVALPAHTAPYRPASADASRGPVATTVDLVAATNAHNSFQNRLAEQALAAGFLPVRSTRTNARFDLGWHDGKTLVAVEVKSLRGISRTNQLRLGLGQILDYAARLRDQGVSLQPVLAVDDPPPDSSHWDALCSEHGVTLVWPDVLERIFPGASKA